MKVAAYRLFVNFLSFYEPFLIILLLYLDYSLKYHMKVIFHSKLFKVFLSIIK
ncbi:unnamed protein product [Paramecium sonneborni]|uniref:Uncharacterized protein n=1 Tax=Paramecium sonneborni TaxID=65129 RepID=A0A8S1N635_9CILI|nr:unnamed protein product [Paramecium sonneborni]